MALERPPFPYRPCGLAGGVALRQFHRPFPLLDGRFRPLRAFYQGLLFGQAVTIY